MFSILIVYENKMNGETVKYQFYEKDKRSFITIPRSMAKGLSFENGDKIGIINLEI